jgi:hypothetical protein
MRPCNRSPVICAFLTETKRRFSRRHTHDQEQGVAEAQLDLDEGDEKWIKALWQRGANQLRRCDLGILRRCAVQIGEIESYNVDAA